MTASWLALAILVGLVLVGAGLGAIGLGSAWLFWTTRRRIADARRRARPVAKALGLRVRAAGLWGVELGGRLADRPVRILWLEEDGRALTEVAVGGAPLGLWILLFEVSGLAGGPEIELGDPTMGDVVLQGPEVTALAILGDDAARETVRAAFTRPGPVAGLPRVAVEDGRVLVRAKGHLRDVEEVRDLLEEALGLARAVEQPPGEPGVHLARHVAGASSPGVRLRCLDVLIEWGLPQAPAAARRALDDPDPGVRLRAARQLGAAETLVALATDPGLPPGVAREALQALDPGSEQGEEAVRHALGRSDPDLLVAALDRAGVALDSGDLPLLEALLERPPLGGSSAEGARRVGRSLARALGRLGTAEAEPALLRLLRAPDVEVCLEAMRSLGRVGTPAAVPALRDRAGPPASDRHDLAEQTVARIHDRVEHGEAGALSLAEVPEARGALSVAGEGGEVSLATPRPGGSDEGRP